MVYDFWTHEKKNDTPIKIRRLQAFIEIRKYYEQDLRYGHEKTMKFLKLIFPMAMLDDMTNSQMETDIKHFVSIGWLICRAGKYYRIGHLAPSVQKLTEKLLEIMKGKENGN